MSKVSLRRLLILICLPVLVLSACSQQTGLQAEGSDELVLELGSVDPPPDFKRVTTVREFTFPDDHGPHFDYQTEWWYYTGNLQTESGQHFGYQFTVFRRAIAPGAPPQGEGLATNQIYFAHIALTDVSNSRHYFDERFSRGAAGLAGAEAVPFNAWVEDWRVEALEIEADQVRITAATENFELDLSLDALKPIVKHGEQGLSAKSEEIGNASYYLSYTRMQTVGELRVGEQSFAVSGTSWFDHEWSTSVLGENAIGWDWFSLQLDDGRELMLFYIRLADGSIDPLSSGTYIERDGSTTALKRADIEIEAIGSWTSEVTGAEYPSGWEINIPPLGMELIVEPLIENQEMRVGFSYWEGAVAVSGAQAGSSISGRGYVELTGYTDSLVGVLS